MEKLRSINNRMIPQNGKSSNIDLEVKECNPIERVKVKKRSPYKYFCFYNQVVSSYSCCAEKERVYYELLFYVHGYF